MPNWCEGTLRIRGKKENIIRLMLEGLEPVDAFGNEIAKMEIDDDCIIPESSRCYIKGTFRGFVMFDEFYLDNYEDGEVISTALDAEFAWGIDEEELQKVCKKCGVDMRIHAFERGMEFNQIIEIIDGEVTKNEELRFDDYIWDCICPKMGG